MNVVLIGYRGSGKTTVGRLLADRLGVAFVDTDATIVEAAGRSITDIFAEEGEAGFRRREREAILRAIAIENRVISIGGGAIEDDRSRAALRAFGHVVWLTADSTVLWQRVQGDAGTQANRPDLAGGGIAEIEAILSRRLPLYAEAAHSQVVVEGKTPAEIVEEIVRLLSSR